MEKNFTIPDGISLQKDNKNYDIHSDWLIKEFDISDKKITMTLVNTKNNSKITCEYKGIKIVSKPQNTLFNKQIGYIGYRHKSDDSVIDGFLTESGFNQSDSEIIIKFEDIETPLRFSCESAILK